MKPHKKKQRFYNHEYDRIRDRLAHMFKESWFYLKRRLFGTHKKRPYFGSEINLNDWIYKETPKESSIEPIITWIGHATFLIQVAGLNILTDPIFFDVEKMPQLFKRRVPAPFTVDLLPKIDIVLISHSHQDHMDKPTLLAIKKDQPKIFVPSGKKNWFVSHGFEHVTESVWWESTDIKNGITLTFLPAVHWTGRDIFDINKSLWGSWLIKFHDIKIYFAGDTAHGKHFGMIKQKYGPIDIAIMPIAPNEPRHFINHVHLSAQEAIKAFIELDAQHFIPMHWGTFESGTDTFIDPINLLKKYWHENMSEIPDKKLHVVKFGEPLVILNLVQDPEKYLT